MAEIDPRFDALVYDLHALISFEKATGLNVLGMKQDDWDALEQSLEKQEALIWAGMLRNSPKVSLEEVGHLIDIGNLGEIKRKAVNAIYASLHRPAPEQKAAEDPQGR
jgi:hypothetical protein